MTKNLVATNREQLECLLSVIRGRFLELDTVSLDADAHVVSMKTDVLGDDHQTVFGAILRIRGAKSLNIADEAQVGEADLNGIEYENDVVAITGSAPVKIEVAASRLDIELEISDEPIRKVSKFRSSFLRS